MPPSVSGPGAGRSDAATLARGIGVLIPGRLAGRTVGYGIQLVLARLLGPAGYGLFGIGWKLLLIGGLLATLGLDNAVVRFGSRLVGRDTGQLHGLVRQVLRATVVSGVGAAAVLAVATPWLAGTVWDAPDLRPVLWIVAAGLLLAPLLRVGAAATRVWQQMRYSVVAEDLAQPLAQLLLVLVFHRLGLAVLGATAAAVLSFGLAAALVLRYLTRLAPGLFSADDSGVATGELIRFALPTSLAGTLSLAAMWIDLLFVGYFRPGVDTGLYMAASQISFLFAVVLTSINAVFSPMIADLHHRGEADRLAGLFRTSTRWGLLLCTPLFVALAANPTGLLSLLMGADYVDGARPMLILACGQMVNLATGAVGFLLVMSGRPALWLGVSAAAVALNVTLNLALIPRLGLTGAATATTLSLIGLFGSGLFLVRRELGLWPYDRSFLRLVLGAAVAAAAVVGIGRIGGLHDAGQTILQLAVAAAVFWTVAGLGGRQGGLGELLDALRNRR